MSEEIHPVILYTASDIPHIYSHIASEPYRTWFEDEQAEADRIRTLHVAWNENTVAPETQAYYAKILAFAWAFSNPLTAQRDQWEQDALLSLYYMPSGTYNPPYTSDLMVAEAALFWAEAYDILKGGGSEFAIEGFSNVENTIRDKLKALRDYMARDSYQIFPSSPRIGNDFPSSVWIESSYSDNHHVKLNAALVAVSLVIADESGFRDDLDHALARLRGSLGNLTVAGEGSEPSGGWAEGPNYLRYSAHQYLGAINALKNAGEADLYEEIPELVATHLLLPYMVMPDGYMPPWDDNQAVLFDLAGLLWSYHTGQPDRDMLYWMWTLAGKPVPKAFRADYIAGFDASPPVYTTPDVYGINPSGFHAESGFVRLRDSWDSDGIYLLFQSEHGEAHTNGQAHEHPDQNSFIMHAFGEMLLLDSGYGGWENRDLTKYAENHNLVLINGEGPPGSSQPLGIGPWTIDGQGAFVEHGFASPGIDYAVSQASYENAIFTRHVVFPDHRYFLLFDTIESASSADFTLLLHGNGGGTSGGTFALTGNGGIWNHNQASVEAFVVGSSGDITFSSEDMHHAVYSQTSLLTHTVLKASQQGISRAYLTMLYPYPSSETAPEITEATVEYGDGIHLQASSVDAYAANRVGVGDVVVKEDGKTIMTSDGIFVWCDVYGSEIPEKLFMEYGMFLGDHSGTIVTASKRINLSIDRSEQYVIEGWVQTDEPTEVTFTDIEADQVTFNGIPVPFEVAAGNTIYTLTGEGSYRITVPVGEIELLAPDGYESWNARESYAITWTSQNIAEVTLEYSLDNGSEWTTIVESIAADTGSYLWDLPDTTATLCLVRITDTDDGTVTDQSDDVFDIYLPTISITSPNGGEEWEVFSQETITWISEYVDNLTIEYSINGGQSWDVFSESVSAVIGFYHVSVPDTTSTECLIRLTDTEDSAITDQSDSLFTMRWEKNIILVTPRDGELWISGTTQDIYWTSQGISFVNLEYSIDGGITWELIAENIPEQPNNYVWTVPDTISSECFIRVSDAGDSSFSDMNSAPFSIDVPSLTITSPNGGESLTSGSSQTITWTSIGVSEITIDYAIDGGHVWTVIEDSTSAVAGSYEWIVPDIESEEYIIRISSVSLTSVIDLSDSLFTVFSDDPNMAASDPHPYLTVSCYPNPFNLKTTLSYQLPHQSDVTITIYNALGQNIYEYRLGRTEPGVHEVVFDAADIPSGLYFYRVVAGSEFAGGKMLLMK